MSYLSGNIASNAPSTQTPGFAGTGMYQTQGYQIDPNAFGSPLDPNALAGSFNTGQNNLLGAANTAAPTLAPAAISNGAGNAGQLGVANQLYGIGTGAIPGAAAKVAAQQASQNQAANLSALGSARGTANPALANYQLGQQNAGVQQNAAANAVAGGAQEQLGALGAAGTAFGGVTQNAQFNAQQINQQAWNQAQLIGQQRGLQGQELQTFINANAQQIANSMLAAQAGQQLGVQNNSETQRLGLNAFGQAAQTDQALTGDVAGIAGGVANGLAKGAIASDRNNKTKVKPAKATIDKFLKQYGRL